VLSRLDRDELVDVERWIGRDELCYALEAPIWDRFGSFAGQPLIVGTVIWITADRRVVIEGRRGAGEAVVPSPARRPSLRACGPRGRGWGPRVSSHLEVVEHFLL
jgi:hypothetical protein